MPTISIVGYTNAGKSTLLNSLTHSSVFVEDKLFATLDPISRRLRFPRDFEVIITDTVGFIRDLPKDLMESFSATLEELLDADLLLHVIDISNGQFEEQMVAVERTLTKLELHTKPAITVFNKTDLVPADFVERKVRKHGGIGISATNPRTLEPLILAMQDHIAGFMDRAVPFTTETQRTRSGEEVIEFSDVHRPLMPAH
jgi:GTP-binding protein HflX